MKEIKRTQTMFFSPTGTTRKVIETISANIDFEQDPTIDLTTPSARNKWSGEVSGDLVIIGVPTYYDTIPSMILSDLNKLRGKGKWSVPVIVYGNVGAGGCLQELCGLLQYRGFKILAAASFIGEHSFASDEAPLASNRPDEKDLETASKFGKMIKDKIGTTITEAPIEGIPLKVGHNYSRKPEEYPENEVVNLASVDYDEPSCIWCLNCVEVCPTGAIDVNTLAINNGLCIRCFACARACPTKALKAAVIKDVIDYFKTILDKRQEPSIII